MLSLVRWLSPRENLKQRIASGIRKAILQYHASSTLAESSKCHNFLI